MRSVRSRTSPDLGLDACLQSTGALVKVTATAQGTAGSHVVIVGLELLLSPQGWDYRHELPFQALAGLSCRSPVGIIMQEKLHVCQDISMEASKAVLLILNVLQTVIKWF
jgi:hypothetical protein